MLENDFLSPLKGADANKKKISPEDKIKPANREELKDIDSIAQKILQESSKEIIDLNELRLQQYAKLFKKLNMHSGTISKFYNSRGATNSIQFNSPLSLWREKAGEQHFSFKTGLTSAKKEFWKKKFEELGKESPGGKVNEIKDEKKQAEILSKEWLVNPPFTTGICMGLAIDFIMQQEIGISDPKMEPSPNVRFFERILIPILLKICKENRVSPDDISIRNRPELVKEVYKKIGEQIKLIKGLDLIAIEECQQRDLQKDFLDDLAKQEDGHHALLLENSKGGVAFNHIIYFNPKTRIIADGASGIIIKVPEEDDFNAVFGLYIQEEYDDFDKFSMFKVKREEGVEVKYPSVATRTHLRAKIFMLKIILLMRIIFDRKKNAQKI